MRHGQVGGGAGVGTLWGDRHGPVSAHWQDRTGAGQGQGRGRTGAGQGKTGQDRGGQGRAGPDSAAGQGKDRGWIKLCDSLAWRFISAQRYTSILECQGLADTNPVDGLCCHSLCWWRPCRHLNAYSTVRVYVYSKFLS